MLLLDLKLDDSLKRLKLQNIPSIINACFLLHNFLEWHSVYISEKQAKTQLELLKLKWKNKWNTIQKFSWHIFYCVEGDGEVIRKALTDYIKEKIFTSICTLKKIFYVLAFRIVHCKKIFTFALFYKLKVKQTNLELRHLVWNSNKN